MTNEELEKRLIKFSVDVIQLTLNLPASSLGKYFADQLGRASISSALNYAESQGSVSRKDYIHKLSIVVKELRESMVCMKIIRDSNQCKSPELLPPIMRENDELIAILTRSILTLKSKQ